MTEDYYLQIILTNQTILTMIISLGIIIFLFSMSITINIMKK